MTSSLLRVNSAVATVPQWLVGVRRHLPAGTLLTTPPPAGTLSVATSP